MKKARLLIPLIAVIISTVTAWASRSKQQCLGAPQYYFNGSTYSPAGVLGRDYICANGTGTCTYYQAGNTYQPCQSGIYTPLNATPPKK